MRSTTNIVSVSATLVPVNVYDAYSLWSFSGTLRAYITGLLDDANITWVQLEGDPVTFTTATNIPVISFTSGNLLNKVFRVYTNQGTSVEQYDDCTFYHHPIDQVLTEHHTVSLMDRTDPLKREDMTVFVKHGMYPVHEQLPRYGIIPKESNLIEFNTYGINTEVAVDGVRDWAIKTKTLLEIESSPGVWTTVSDTYGMDGIITGLTSPPRITYTYNYYGVMYQHTFDVGAETSGNNNGAGLSNLSMVEHNTDGQLLNMVSTVHTIKEAVYVNTVHTAHTGSAELFNLVSTPHTIVEKSYLDTVTVQYSAEGSISNLVSTIHQSTSVGG